MKTIHPLITTFALLTTVAFVFQWQRSNHLQSQLDVNHGEIEQLQDLVDRTRESIIIPVTADGPCKCCKCEACQCNAIERQKESAPIIPRPRPTPPAREGQ